MEKIPQHAYTSNNYHFPRREQPNKYETQGTGTLSCGGMCRVHVLQGIRNYLFSSRLIFVIMWDQISPGDRSVFITVGAPRGAQSQEHLMNLFHTFFFNLENEFWKHKQGSYIMMQTSSTCWRLEIAPAVMLTRGDHWGRNTPLYGLACHIFLWKMHHLCLLLI